MTRWLRLPVAWILLAILGGCAAPAPPVDYTAFRQGRPRSILVLPPRNASPDIGATYAVLSQVTYPLAEAGYYVLPVTLVDRTFKENGVTQPAEMHAMAPDRLKAIFGADAVLYLDVDEYGTRYQLFDSKTRVMLGARLVELDSGIELWHGTASASSDEGGSHGGSNLVSMLLTAALKQIVNTATDASYRVAGVATQRLLSPGRAGGMLYGPRSRKFGTD